MSSLLFAACGKTIIEYLVKSEFRYINKTSHPIKINIYGNISGSPFNSYDVAPNDSLVLVDSDQTHEQEAQPEYYVPLLQGDSVEIIIFDTLYYTEYKEKAILNNINSYEYYKRGVRDYVFTYNIDSVILKLATPK